MPEPAFNDEWRYNDRSVHDGVHELKHAEREKMHAVKEAVKCEARTYNDLGRQGPRTVDEVLVEIDSYISYLEDLPKEKLASCGDKLDRLAEHLDKVRSSLKESKKSGGQ